ncbi:hypothetical protein ASPZODRAFT_141119 [Penicilliopsis zonata CBS 506.65]|uniref:alpha-glucosidase n=1 Tax=Penicilliopsis zonata CBS 506.65 TaxID=1073090 RepID=A0A1L9SJY8_9EURO|nr:hypothetical protein ASPZODRAFT_141119 [Penicilliopsis zonata CBS 506.65]OJJ47530.1 hypothetical protein ASPZODRAFT_141119 [Penicilliopsis zonata CBS 506.65]
MPQKETCPRGYQPVDDLSNSPQVHLRSSTTKQPFDFTFEAIRPRLFRVTFSSPNHPLPPYPSVRQPQTDLQDASVATKNDTPSQKTICVDDVTAVVEWKQTPVVSLSWTGEETAPLHKDLPLRSYVADGEGIAYYSVHDRKALHVGLGEKRAPMDLTGRHFQLSATDSFGYDVYKTDPLYKHVPLLIKATPAGCVAIFSTTHARGSWAVGSEIDGLWGHFKAYRQDHGGLEQYLIVGRTLREVVRSYAELMGFPLLVPRWAYGYISGGYKYTVTDDPPAHQGMMDFADKLVEHDIPCSAHQMSSGYSIAATEPKVRNVFTWNRHRFPDPEAFIAKYHARGIRLITNIKPFVLASHPDYQKLVDAGGLFTNPETGKEGTMRLWSAGGGEGGDGCHLDFTSSFTFKWWYAGVQQLKREGIDGMWNDNNEYTLPNDEWEIRADDEMVAPKTQISSKAVGLWGRAVHTELMCKSSHDALLAMEPTERPFVLTRSATAGTMRYSASTWSGDNMTSWESMRGSNALSLNSGLSLIQCTGHDIGGFEGTSISVETKVWSATVANLLIQPGPQPSPELLLRWVQLGIYSPRFAINCFKTSPTNNAVGEVIEPWMYPEITPLVRATIKRRYEILPYIYSLGLESHLSASPPQRWVGWNHESDPEVWSPRLKQGDEQYWFGDAMLVAGVYQPGQTVAEVYLPRSSSSSSGGFDYGFVNMNAPYEYLASGQWVQITSNWKESIPLLAKIGAAIPVGKPVHTRVPGDETRASKAVTEEDDYRGVEIFPPRGTSHGTVFKSTWMEDDGISLQPKIARYTLSYSSTEDRIVVGFERDESAGFVPAWKDLDIILHHGDERRVVSDRDAEIVYKGEDDRGRVVYTVKHS